MTLHDLIVNNRKNLDTALPDKAFIWEGIRYRVQRRRQRRTMVMTAMGVAALLAVVFLSSVLLRPRAGYDAEFNGDAAFVRQRDGFVREVVQLELKLHESGVPRSGWPDLQELRYTDDLITLYTNNLNLLGPNPELINTLLDLHTKKILILERMLNQIQNSSHYEMAQTTL